jgi:hypothetical protein
MGKRDAGALVDRVLNDPTTRVMIACDAADHRRIFGFLVYADIPRVRCVHYVSVRAKYRRSGLATKLIVDAGLRDASKPLVYTLEGPSSRALAGKLAGASRIDLDEVLS